MLTAAHAFGGRAEPPKDWRVRSCVRANHSRGGVCRTLLAAPMTAMASGVCSYTVRPNTLGFLCPFNGVGHGVRDHDHRHWAVRRAAALLRRQRLLLRPSPHVAARTDAAVPARQQAPAGVALRGGAQPVRWRRPPRRPARRPRRQPLTAPPAPPAPALATKSGPIAITRRRPHGRGREHRHRQLSACSPCCADGTLTKASEIAVGLEPRSVALLPNKPRAYVANTVSGTVSVIDLVAGVVSRRSRSAPSRGPSRRRRTARYVYVANANSNSVSVIDTATNAIIATIPVGRSPRALAITSDGDADDTRREALRAELLCPPARRLHPAEHGDARRHRRRRRRASQPAPTARRSSARASSTTRAKA